MIDVHRQHNGDGHREVDENVEGEKGVEPGTHAGDFFQNGKRMSLSCPAMPSGSLRVPVGVRLSANLPIKLASPTPKMVSVSPVTF